MEWVTLPRSRLVVTLQHVPWVTSPFLFTSPGHVPPPLSQSEPMYMMHCSDWGALLSGCSWVPHGAKLEALSWSCVARWHAAAFYSKRRAGPISQAAGFIAGWSCRRRMNRSSLQLVSHC